VETLVEDFHQLHEEIFAIRDPGSVVELVGWKATVRCRLAHNEGGRVASTDSDADTVTRRLYIGGVGAVDAAVHRIDSLEVDAANSGPAIIESPFTTVVAEPGSQFVRTRNGNLVLSFIESGVS
jgi:N-methylhydantoinase A